MSEPARPLYKSGNEPAVDGATSFRRACEQLHVNERVAAAVAARAGVASIDALATASPAFYYYAMRLLREEGWLTWPGFRIYLDQIRQPGDSTVPDALPRRVYFECGHRCTWPDDWNDRVRRAAESERTVNGPLEKFWRDQSPPAAIGYYSLCPYCPGKKGKSQPVVGVVVLPLPTVRDPGR